MFGASVGLKFRLRGLAQTFLTRIVCPGCKYRSSEPEGFGTDGSRVTFIGIVVVAECKCCGEFFVPDGQRFEVLDAPKLIELVKKDWVVTGGPEHRTVWDVELHTERLNAERRGRLQ